MASAAFEGVEFGHGEHCKRWFAAGFRFLATPIVSCVSPW